jgi:protein-S-isoprenylcysteine O-methyltransferase Ste14
MSHTTDHAHIVVNPFVICGGAFVLALAAQWVLPLPFVSATAARIAGTAVFVAGLVFGLPAARLMRSAKTTFNPGRATTMLLTTGRFRRSRNPIYVALLANYAGLAIFFGTLWGLIFIPAVIWLMNRWVIVPEEQYLHAKFGDAYSAYAASVHRWL